MVINPSKEETPKPAHISEFLDGKQRDALIAANVYLTTLQRGDEGTYFFARIQKTIDVISDMLYGNK